MTYLNAAARQSLLDLDPDLAVLLPADQQEAARRHLTVQVVRVARGAWDVESLACTNPSHLGLLVLTGLMARELIVGQTVTTELLGEGDLLRPWQVESPSPLLDVVVRWNALVPVEAAVLDRSVAAALNAYPEIRAVLLDRLNVRAQRLALIHAISNLTGVEDRLHALLCHFAERWGRVTRDGVLIPVALSHRQLGQLVGARRPTVSTALARLSRDGRVSRRDDGTWLVTETAGPAPAATPLAALPTYASRGGNAATDLLSDAA